MTGNRATSRRETTARIMFLARDQIADRGASDLSLREIAREMGMASSAMYRYFASRDQLLTALIIESYDALGEFVEKADARCERNDFIGRWLSMTNAIRDWAVEHPSDYGLIFGTPVPGYEAPDDTTAPGQRYTTALIRLITEADAAGCAARVDLPSSRIALREYKKVRANLAIKVSDEMLIAGLTAWATVLGAISLEMFGHVDTIFDDPSVHFSALTAMLGQQLMGLD